MLLHDPRDYSLRTPNGGFLFIPFPECEAMLFAELFSVLRKNVGLCYRLSCSKGRFFVILRMKQSDRLETSGTIYPTRRHMPEDFCLKLLLF
jgi:hypothetical protein